MLSHFTRTNNLVCKTRFIFQAYVKWLDRYKTVFDNLFQQIRTNKTEISKNKMENKQIFVNRRK